MKIRERLKRSVINIPAMVVVLMFVFCLHYLTIWHLLTCYNWQKQKRGIKATSTELREKIMREKFMAMRRTTKQGP